MYKFLYILVFICIALDVHAQTDWKPLSTPNDNNNTIHHLAVIGNAIFAGTQYGGVLRSTDNGETWVYKNTGLAEHSVSRMVVNTKGIYIVTPSGVYFSSDTGDTWLKLNIGKLFTTGVSYLYCKDSLLILGGNNGEYYKSIDNGNKWDKITKVITMTSVVATRSSAGSFLIGTANYGLVRSSDDGLTWHKLDAEKYGYSTSSFTSKDSMLFVVSESKGIYRSTDNGDTWTNLGSSFTLRDIVSLSLSPTMITAVTFRKGDKINYTEIYTSSDNGDSWKAVSKATINAEVFKVAMSGPTLFVGTLGQGMFRSNDSGANWQALNLGRRFKDVWALLAKEKTILAATDGSLFRSSDNGNSWSPIHTGLFNADVRCFAKNDSFMFAGTFGGGVFCSKDDGLTWTGVSAGLNNKYIRSLVAKGSLLFAGTDSGGIYHSSDNGKNWSHIKSGLSDQIISALWINDTFLFAGTLDSSAFRSADNSVSWKSIRPGKTSNYKYVNFICGQDSAIFVGVKYTEDISTMYRSTDNGVSWEDNDPGYNQISMYSNGKMLFLGLDRGILTSTNGGKSWWVKPWIDYNPIANITFLSFTANSTTAFAGSEGHGIWAYDLLTDAVENQSNSLDAVRSLSCYPNPAEHSLTIDRTSLQIPENTPVHYTLSSLIGGKVMEFDNSELKFTVMLDGVANGVYNLIAESGRTRSVILVTLKK